MSAMATVAMEQGGTPAPASEKPNRVMIYVRGGVVQGVSADRPGELDVLLVDFDDEREGQPLSNGSEGADGGRYAATEWDEADEGWYRAIERETGQLTSCFLPRSARTDEEA